MVDVDIVDIVIVVFVVFVVTASATPINDFVTVTVTVTITVTTNLATTPAKSYHSASEPVPLALGSMSSAQSFAASR